MRHYPPHNTHVQRWSPPTLSPAQRSQLITSLRSLLSTMAAPFRAAPAHHPPYPSPPASAADPRDHLRPLFLALRRWLPLDIPLSPDIRRALLSLLPPLPSASLSTNPAPPVCLLCDVVLPRPSSTTHPPPSPPSTTSTQTHPPVLPFFLHLLYSLFHIALYFFAPFLVPLHRIRTYLSTRRRLHTLTDVLHTRLSTATTYASWRRTATALDHLSAPVVDAILCPDCMLLAPAQRQSSPTPPHLDVLVARLRELAPLFARRDLPSLASTLRQSLVRNLAGMAHPDLYLRTRVNAVPLVSDFVVVTSFLVALLACSDKYEEKHEQDEKKEKRNEGKNDTIRSKEISTGLSIDEKLAFLNEARHAHGRTALMLSGGAAMGLHHLGVVKALLDQNLLPKVVCGTSAGALVASLVAIFTDSQLAGIFRTDELINPVTNQPFCFRYFDDDPFRRLRRLFRSGVLHDVAELQRCLKENIGDLTFEEAYHRTRRILNITVCPLHGTDDPPLLLNYLTAPRVLIWSAASASCALPLVFAPVELMAKGTDGREVAYHPHGVRWIDGSISSDVPLSRIGELFNVNHFLVSQTNPHIIPRSLPIMQTRLALLVKSELQFRYWQMLQMGLVPKLVASIFPHFMQPYAGDVTIMPDVRLADLANLLSNPSLDTVWRYARRGEVQTFPFVERIRIQCVVERTLDAAVEQVALQAKGQVHETVEMNNERYMTRRESSRRLSARVPSWLWLDARSIASPLTSPGQSPRVRTRQDVDIISADYEMRLESKEKTADEMVGRNGHGWADVDMDGIVREVEQVGEGVGKW